MGEIKSTLDLVMEKTRNMSLSAEERKAQKDKEISSRIRGLLQKFADRALSTKNFRSEYQKLQKDYDLSGNTPLIKEIFSRIELTKDNQSLFDLLAEYQLDFEGLASVLEDFQAARDTAARNRCKIIKDQLAKTHFISGSAVVANLENDDQWQKEAGEIQSKFDRLLAEAKAGILKGQSEVSFHP